MIKIYMVSLRWIETPQNAEMIDNLLGMYGDWLRWNGWTWFVSTGFSPTAMRTTIMSRLSPSDSLIICEMTKSQLEGWAPQWAWDWFNVRWANDSNPPPVPQPPKPGSLF
jgi:hypothetical protein